MFLGGLSRTLYLIFKLTAVNGVSTHGNCFKCLKAF